MKHHPVINLQKPARRTPPPSMRGVVPEGKTGVIKTKMKGTEAEIRIDGVIGGDWFGEGITKESFAAEMKTLKAAKQIHLRINSEGGSVFDAEAMYTLLRAHGAKITVHIDSLAASAASFLAMAGDEIEMSEHAFIMIHNPYMIEMGDDEQMIKAAEMLRKVKEQVANLYAARTDQKQSDILTWMKETSWFTAAEALDKGFTDKVIANNKRVAAMIHCPERIRANMPTILLPNRARVAAALKRA